MRIFDSKVTAQRWLSGNPPPKMEGLVANLETLSLDAEHYACRPASVQSMSNNALTRPRRQISGYMLGNPLN